MRRALVALAALALLALAACSGERSRTASDTQDAADVTPVPAAASPATEVPLPSASVAAPSPSPRTAAPVLRIISPASGETASLPLEVRYEIGGLDAGPGKGHVHVAYGKGAKEFVEMPVGGPSGSAVADGLPEGTFDLVFSLVRADHSAAGPVATVRNVTLITRGAGGGGPEGY